MELRHLRYFVVVAEELNMRCAAERLNIAQPPLSRQIHDLEDELGVKLFDRSNRKLTLTKAGALFLKETRNILSNTQRATQFVQAFSRGESGTLVIAIGPTAGILGILPSDVLQQCHKRYPSMEIIIKQMAPNEQMAALLENRVDIGFIGLRQTELEDVLCFEGILEIEILLVLPEEHPLLNHKRISLGKCVDQPFVFFERSAAPSAHDMFLNLCKTAGFTPNIVQRADQPQNLLQLVAAGFGISLVPDFFQNYPMRGVVFRPLAGKTRKYFFSIAWRQDNQSHLLKVFLEILRENIRKDSAKPSK